MYGDLTILSPTLTTTKQHIAFQRNFDHGRQAEGARPQRD